MRKMKDSGVEWIGEIPESWYVSKLKYLFADGDNGLKIGPFGSAIRGKTLEEGPYKIYNQANLIQNDFNLNRHFVSEETYQQLESYRVKPGDVLFSMMGTIGKCRIMPKGYPEGIMDSHLLKAGLNQKMLPEFFVYAYDKDYSEQVISQLLYASNGTIMNGLNSTILKSVVIAVPSMEEQRIIVNYLDTKCSKIDAIISRQEEIIEKLKDYKLSIITEAVTKGLNPDVEMRDSRVAWIGDMPMHWKQTSVGKVATVVRGASPRPAGDPRYFNGSDVPWITVAEVTNGDGKYVEKTDTFLTIEGAKHSRLVEVGTLLLSNSGATLGVPKVTKIEGCINDGSVAFYNLKIDKMFLLYIFRARTLELRKQMQGYGQPNLNTDIVKSIEVTLPPVEEQKKIVAFLDSKCECIESYIRQKDVVLQKVKEYKKSLIYEVVTGKKEV